MMKSVLLQHNLFLRAKAVEGVKEISVVAETSEREKQMWLVRQTSGLNMCTLQSCSALFSAFRGNEEQ